MRDETRAAGRPLGIVPQRVLVCVRIGVGMLVFSLLDLLELSLHIMYILLVLLSGLLLGFELVLLIGGELVHRGC